MPLSFKFWFVNPNNSWFLRGGHWPDGIETGVFALGSDCGLVRSWGSFRKFYTVK